MTLQISINSVILKLAAQQIVLWRLTKNAAKVEMGNHILADKPAGPQSMYRCQAPTTDAFAHLDIKYW